MRIITRKKGNKKYFYLQHSLRKSKKIVTKEKYLGTEVPADVSEIISRFRKEMQNDINKKLEVIKEHFQSEWKRIPESAKEKELEEISISFTYNTNAIEGSTITLEEAREIIHDKISPNKPLRDVRETEAHSKVFLQMLKKNEKITKELLLIWHKNVFGETKPDIAGRFRDYLVRVGPHLAPDWQDVENLMKDFIEFINKNKKMNPVELAGRVHYQFEKIHPFGDGNGRIGRLLMNFILWHNEYPMLIIEYKKRKSYYKSLQKDEEYFVSYFIRRYLTVHKKRYLE
ncbi:MAG: Fic family protein [Candidatus Pacearchaeota archaeon]|nr:Fic family protein [Candidatus Pacearchaeota archaeon]